jgi:enoyl-CoA hydratase/carnithine racemase
LINQVTPVDQLEAVVLTMARQIAEQSPLAIKWAKKTINASQELGLTMGLAYEGLAACLLFSSKDREEGMKAFLEKRKPIFKGE